MRRFLLAMLVLLVLPAEASGACVAAIAVDGVLLISFGESRALPETAGRVPAIEPACNDTPPAKAPDRRISAKRIRGVPPTVAVTYRGWLYFDDASLVAASGHPLRGHVRLRPKRRRRCRPLPDPIVGEVSEPGPAGFRLGRMVDVDGRTRIVNRPAYRPVRKGQRLRIAASRCGARTFADRIRFVGPDVPAERFVPDFTGRDGIEDDPEAWMLLLLLVPAVLVGGLYLARRT